MPTRSAFRFDPKAILGSFVTGVVFVVLVVVEVIFGVPGFGALLYNGIHDRDVGIILGTTVVPVVFIMLGNLAQDLAQTVIDPRVEAE